MKKQFLNTHTLVTCCLALVSIFLTSCEDDDNRTHYSDASIDEIPSLWEVNYYEIVGTTFNNAIGEDYLEIDTCSGDRYYVLFDVDSKGRVFQTHKDKIEMVSDFDYLTNDNCHFELSFNGKIEHWTFANKSYKAEGKQVEQGILYKDSVYNGFNLKCCHDCREIRNDSVLYFFAPQLRNLLHVPACRIFPSKTLQGKFDSIFTNGYYEFFRNGKFALVSETSNDRSNGKYEIISTDGSADTLTLTFDDGTVKTYNIVIGADNFFLLYDEYGKALRFDYVHWPF